ncbi:MAG: DUF86 domain-containing protein [Acidobacteriota bacterium]|nr:DUF86 domain-containing protein [Acidobacteriota bacterium]
MIEDFTLGMSFGQFREDSKTVAAVERKFLVIGEAAVRLGREAPLIVADVPWRQFRDLGNLLRHAYDKVDLEIIWQTIIDESAALESRCSKGTAVASMQSGRSGLILRHMHLRVPGACEELTPWIACSSPDPHGTSIVSGYVYVCAGGCRWWPQRDPGGAT